MNNMINLPPTLRKHLLFYSKYCHNSTRAIELIRDYHLKYKFMCICIEIYEIPSFVKSVPLILTMDTIILTDQDVCNFILSQTQHHIEGDVSVQNSISSNHNLQNGKELQYGECMAASDFSDKMSDRYSFVDNIAHNKWTGKRFMSLDMISDNGGFPIICQNMEGVPIDRQQQMSSYEKPKDVHQKYDSRLGLPMPTPMPIINEYNSNSSEPILNQSTNENENKNKEKTLDQIIQEREFELRQLPTHIQTIGT